MLRVLIGLLASTLCGAALCAQEAPPAAAPPAAAAPGEKAAATADPIAAELTQAKKDYETALLEAREALIEAFEPVEAKIAENPKLKTADRLRQIESLQEERKAFESEGTLPKSLGLKAAVSDYRTKISTAQRTCEGAFDAAAEKYLKVDLEAAKTVIAEKKEFFPPDERPVVRALPKDSRKFWRFAPTHGGGYFKQVGDGRWEEIGRNGDRMGIWIERKRNKEYVELEDLKRGYLTRLASGKAWIASNKDKKFNPSPHGDWER